MRFIRARYKIVTRPSSLVILTGAGISKESGLDTFRDKKGIWAKVDHRELATPEGFARNPVKVHDFYNRRRRQLRDALPNPAHHALARLEGAWRGGFLLVTQNVDDLHEAAGSRKLIHMHGELNSGLCEACGLRGPWKADMSTYSQCPHCSTVGRMRPDIVWFGEMPYQMDVIYRALREAELFVAIGTSGNVYPAAQFVEEAKAAGAHSVEINLDVSENTGQFDEVIRGPASVTVPAFVDHLLGEA